MGAAVCRLPSVVCGLWSGLCLLPYASVSSLFPIARTTPLRRLCTEWGRQTYSIIMLHKRLYPCWASSRVVEGRPWRAAACTPLKLHKTRQTMLSCGYEGQLVSSNLFYPPVVFVVCLSSVHATFTFTFVADIGKLWATLLYPVLCAVLVLSCCVFMLFHMVM